MDVVTQFQPGEPAGPDEAPGWSRVQPAPPATGAPVADLADVRGQAGAKRALEIAAAGAHGLLLVCKNTPHEW
jgi:magnesium chelatase family protein